MTGGEDPYPTRSFGAGRASFVVACPSAKIKDVVEELFGDLPDGEAGEECRLIRLTTNTEGLLELFIAEGDQVGGLDLEGAVASLVTSVSRLALDAEPSRLHLHCAALSLDGMGLLISAPSGTGKSVLAAALALQGWTYLSDEAVSIGLSSSTVTGFAKPLVIKPGGRELLPNLETAQVLLGPDQKGAEDWWHVPIGALSGNVTQQVAPCVVVILGRSADGNIEGSPSVNDLHPTDAVVALMSQTMDAKRFGGDALVALARVAARCRCLAMTVGPLDEATGLLDELVRTAYVAEAEVIELESVGGEMVGDTTWRASPAVRSVLINERVVLYDAEGGATAALDEAGSAIWLALHGRAPKWLHGDQLHSRETNIFLEQLASHGLAHEHSTE